MSKIPTAEEFFDSVVGYTHTEMCERAIEFAKLHVEASLKEAKNLLKDGYVTPQDEQDILNAYPLTNIK